MQTKSNSNAVTSKRLTGNSMANSSNITNNAQSAGTNGELNVVTTKAQQQTKSATDSITQQQLTTSSAASPHVITVVTPTSASQPHGKHLFQ